MKKKGIFIYIEGLDGSGKTTHAHLLVNNLQKKGFEATYTTEPSQGELGRFIRRTILEGKKRVPKVVEALLFAIDRVEHCEINVKPALAQGKIVISDRCFYSSFAYQGSTELDLEWIKEINRFAFKPDLVLYIDVPPETVLKRIKRKKSVMEKLETQRRVHEVYVRFINNGEIKPIDGDNTKAVVEKRITKFVLEFLKTLSPI